MDTNNALDVIKECSALSHGGAVSFAEVVRRLSAAGVERYHVDISRDEATYYLPSGETHVLPGRNPPVPIAQAFDPDAIREAVRGAQRGEVAYPEFLRRVMAAGCVGYFAQLTGRCVQYIGRAGDMHVERFPAMTASGRDS